MSEFEQILTVKVVELASKENTSGRKVYVAVGTGFLRSEELSCRGRVPSLLNLASCVRCYRRCP
jgi:cleavage and polyadenylation specificity factor subunit 1